MKRPASRRPFCWHRSAITGALQPRPQQTVDGVQGALEIRLRSSYVPNSPNWRSITGFRAMRA
jgi:hypothetical protein